MPRLEFMILICSAWEQELTAIKELASSHKRIKIASLGIGFLNAALKLEEILKKNAEINQIIFLGTAGAYSKEVELKKLFNIKSVALLNLGSKMTMSYIPENYHEAKNPFHAQEVKSELANAHCLTSLEISTDEKLAKLITDEHQEICLENMELYGLAKIAAQHAIPWNAILAVSNHIHKDANQEWQANHQALANDLGQKALELINSLSPVA